VSVDIWMGLVACTSFALVSDGWLPVVLLLIAAIALNGRVRARYSATPEQQRRRFLLLSLPFGLTVLVRLFGSRLNFQTPQFVAVTGTVYILCCAVLEMYRQVREARPANYHLGMITAIFVAGITTQNWSYPFFLLTYFALAVKLLRYPYGGWWGREGKAQAAAPWWGTVLACGLALAMAYPARALLPGLGRALTQIYSQGLLNTTLGSSALFGSFSDLNGTLRSGRSRILVARVEGPPTLLRTQVYNTYSAGRWLAPTVTRQNRLELKPGPDRRITLPGPVSTPLRHWNVAPVLDISGPIPVAGDTYQLQGLPSVNLDVLDSLTADAYEPYDVWGGGQLQQRSPHRPAAADPGYLQVPEDLVAPLKSWSDPLVGSGSAVTLLTEVLSQQGIYEPQARRPAGMDPVAGFLQGGLHGHCELFASTLALSLRLRGIPTRYVVGFQMNEYNALARHYLVRERDAHAWVEVYLDGRWQTFDPTPASQTEAAHPDGNQLEFADQLVDWVRSAWAAFLSRLRRTTLPAWPLLFGLAGTLVWLGWRFRNRWGGWFSATVSRDELGELLMRFEKRVRVERQPQETVLEYARRLPSPHADWLEDYARARFAGVNLTEELRARLQQLGPAEPKAAFPLDRPG